MVMRSPLSAFVPLHRAVDHIPSPGLFGSRPKMGHPNTSVFRCGQVHSVHHDLR